MRKAFKVATVFTGTAALAATLAPAAEAATTAKTQQVELATSHWNCTIGPRTTATVFFWPASKHHGPTCFGDANRNHQAVVVDNSYSSYCPGNNWGKFHAFFGGSFIIHPGQTKHALNDNFVSWVSISNFSGTDTCAT